MILRDPLEVRVVLNLDVSRDLFEVTIFGMGEHLLPIYFGVPLDGLHAEFPGTILTGVLLHAVGICTIIHLHDFNVEFVINLLDMTGTHSFPEVSEELNVWGSLLTSFELANNIDSLTLRKELLQVLLGRKLGVVERQQPVP